MVWNNVLSIVGTLLAVVLILVMTYFVTKGIGKGMMAKSGSRYLKLLDRLSLGQDKALAVVQINDKKFLIGISSSQITYLTQLDEELEPVAVTPAGGVHTGSDFRQIFEQMKNGKK